MDKRNELCEKALEYFLDHGLAELSLRPLAEGIGTSARLLIYHFGSKENLIAVVMAHARSRVQRSVIGMMQAAGGRPDMASVWGWVSAPENMRYVRLLFEVQILALQHPQVYAHYLTDTSASWLELIEQGIPDSAERRTVATLCSAVIDGLALDYMSTGELDRTSAALHFFVSLLSRHHILPPTHQEPPR
jgi:AcrR family transcriptional regulator